MKEGKPERKDTIDINKEMEIFRNYINSNSTPDTTLVQKKKPEVKKRITKSSKEESKLRRPKPMVAEKNNKVRERKSGGKCKKRF